MSRQVQERSFDDAVQWLRDHGFDILEAPGTEKRVFLKKYGVSAAIQPEGDGVKVFAHPGYLIQGEISKLVEVGRGGVGNVVPRERWRGLVHGGNGIRPLGSV